ncbi:hypothetical protein [Blastococcus brunescens]|uniref:Uncharacterized protein n=1 Tax=Blastococcus brunescens TaxID=1564165 RepID=A0ABZ1B924_9ACTN|nr:hypothetical protein [Blastococcus sp. BMG 8361]WRL66621.1 hypothetical protein U6N30_15215 [Blastococcus sp. BMG 8361]
MTETGRPVCVALGDSTSIDDHAGGLGRSAASSLVANRDEGRHPRAVRGSAGS